MGAGGEELETKPFACSSHSQKVMEAKNCVFITVSLSWRTLPYLVYSHHPGGGSMNWTNRLQILQEVGRLVEARKGRRRTSRFKE